MSYIALWMYMAGISAGIGGIYFESKQTGQVVVTLGDVVEILLWPIAIPLALVLEAFWPVDDE